MKSRYLIVEYNEFTGKTISNTPAVDRSLSVNSTSNNSASNITKDAILRLNAIISVALIDLDNTTGYIIDQAPSDLKILRIYKNDSYGLNVYVSFIVNDIEYYGVIENINKPNTIFKSEVFSSPSLGQSKEWKIRVTGLITKTINAWFIPERSKYVALKDVDCTADSSGKQLTINKNVIIEVIGVTETKIRVLLNNKINATITGDDFYYFNYFFQKILDPKSTTS